MAKQPPISKAFALPTELLAAVAAGTYDALNFDNGSQKIALTRYGYGLGTAAGQAGGDFDSINVNAKKRTVDLQRIPVGALASGADVMFENKPGKKTILNVTHPGPLAGASTTTRAAVAAGVAGLLIVGLVAFTLR